MRGTAAVGERSDSSADERRRVRRRQGQHEHRGARNRDDDPVGNEIDGDVQRTHEPMADERADDAGGDTTEDGVAAAAGATQ
jgi:hypothetical protein